MRLTNTIVMLVGRIVGLRFAPRPKKGRYFNEVVRNDDGIFSTVAPYLTSNTNPRGL